MSKRMSRREMRAAGLLQHPGDATGENESVVETDDVAVEPETVEHDGETAEPEVETESDDVDTQDAAADDSQETESQVAEGDETVEAETTEDVAEDQAEESDEVSDDDEIDATQPHQVVAEDAESSHDVEIEATQPHDVVTETPEESSEAETESGESDVAPERTSVFDRFEDKTEESATAEADVKTDEDSDDDTTDEKADDATETAESHDDEVKVPQAAGGRNDYLTALRQRLQKDQPETSTDGEETEDAVVDNASADADKGTKESTDVVETAADRDGDEPSESELTMEMPAANESQGGSVIKTILYFLILAIVGFGIGILAGSLIFGAEGQSLIETAESAYPYLPGAL